MPKRITKDLFDELQSLAHSYINEKGQEMLNPIPKELAGGLERPPTMQERVARLLDAEIARRDALKEFESLRDANTFDLEDPMTVRLSGWELSELPLADEDLDFKKQEPVPKEPSEPAIPPDGDENASPPAE